MKTLARVILRFLAGAVLRRYHPLVVAVAGSVGKTTTKEAIAAVLGDNNRIVRKTLGSFNAEVGVPVTVISGGSARVGIWHWLKVVIDGCRLLVGRDPRYPQFLVLELGADHPGDLRPLVALIKPKIGVLTSVAPEHLEYFGDQAAVLAEESLVVKMLGSEETAVLNIDDPDIAALTSKLSARTITYGWNPQADIRAESVLFTRNERGLPSGMVVKIGVGGSTIPVALPGVLGRHQAYPLLAAIATGIALGDEPLGLSQRLRAFQPPPGRMRLFDGLNGSLLIDDSYNASPSAMTAALTTLADLEIPGRKVAVLGQMSELGAAAAHWHDQIGRSIKSDTVDELITVGPLAARIGQAAVQSGYSANNIQNVATAEAAAAYLQGQLGPGDAVLFKGSRYANRLERGVAIVLANPVRDRIFLVQGD